MAGQPYLSPFHSRFITKLHRNYRSHPAILRLPSDMFYRGELQACADAATVNSMLPWAREYARGAGSADAWRECPVVFLGLLGREMRELDSPSYWNALEAAKVRFRLCRCRCSGCYCNCCRHRLTDPTQVAEFVQQLLRSTRVRVSTRDIGVIVPYRQQVRLARHHARICANACLRSSCSEYVSCCDLWVWAL